MPTRIFMRRFDISLAAFVRHYLQLLLLIYPSWAVIGAQVDYFSRVNGLAAALKYAMLFGLVFLLCVFCLVARWPLRKSLGFRCLAVFLIYCLLHVFGDVGLPLIFEGFRHEVIFVWMSSMLLAFGLAQREESCLPSERFLYSSIMLNGLAAAGFGVWQVVDLGILETLYREPVEQIGNLTLAVGVRIVSTMVNPINLGAYMVLFIIASYYYSDSKSFRKLFYVILLPLAVALIFASLSRLAMVAFVLSIIFLLLLRRSMTALGFIAIAIFASSTFFIGYEEVSPIRQRTQTLLEPETFSGNARLNNWRHAVSSLQPYELVWGRGIGASSPDASIVEEFSAVRVENAFISSLVQYGMIGFLLQIAMTVRFFYIGLKLRNHSRSFGGFLASFVLFFSIMSIGNDFFRNSPFVFYYWLLYAQAELFYIEATRCKDRFV